jgi:glycine/D-amino acid oxidase-like deaminating enzyme
MKLIVIGAGIAGSSATRIARTKGWDVTLIDNAPEVAGSRSALATIRPTWFDKAERVDLERSWEWYSAWGATGSREAYVSNWRDREVKKQKDWWLVDPLLPLVEPDVKERVVGIYKNYVTTDAGQLIEADAILNCTGAYGSELSSGVSLFAGVTWISTNAEIDYSPYRVHHLRPYKSLSVAQVNGVTRLGSSIAATADKAIDDGKEMLMTAIALGIVKSGEWEMSLGWRAKGKGGIPIYPELGERNAYFSGLARSGYGLSPAIAEKWIDSVSFA